MRYTFILVEPAVAENVGSSARALKTMGFDSLVLVNSKAHLRNEARWLAHGSSDVLDGIRVFDTLQEAVTGMDLVIGTTAKKRRVHADYYLCNEIAGLVNSKSEMIENVALVFGREESGLTNRELKLCNVFSGIPMYGRYPSLNLAQAVMVYAWELSEIKNFDFKTIANSSANLSAKAGWDTKMPARAKFRHLRKSAGELLRVIGYDNESAVYCRILERLEAVGDKDAGLLLSVCSRLHEALKD